MHLIVRLARTAAVTLAIGLAFAAPAASGPSAAPGVPRVPSVPADGWIGATPPLDQPAPLELADTAWRFVEILGAPTPSTVEATLALFADGTAAGRAGCNYFHGRYVVAEGGLTFTGLGYTKMACAPELMTTEMAVQTVLNRTVGGTTAVDELRLLAAGGTLLARLVPATSPPAATTG